VAWHGVGFEATAGHGPLASLTAVSALTIRRQLRRYRRRNATIFAVVTLAGLIAAHHSALQMDMDHHEALGAVAELCLGVFTAVGAAVIAVAVALLALGRRRSPRTARMTGPSPARLPVARARHGPAVVAVLCVDRR
jgi:hypothetical protein